MSLGNDRVRVEFNPAGHSLVNQIKQKSADLIDFCEKEKSQNHLFAETVRLWSLAQEAYEVAAMWAVKAATAKN